MTIEEAIAYVRQEINDETEEYTDSQIIRYLNTAIQKASMCLIAHNSYLMALNDEIKNGAILPNNFVKFAGSFPLKMNGKEVEFFDKDLKKMKVRYFATKDTITNKFDKIPFDHETIIQYIIDLASILALNHNEFEVSQDNAISQLLQEMVEAVCNG